MNLQFSGKVNQVIDIYCKTLTIKILLQYIITPFTGNLVVTIIYQTYLLELNNYTADARYACLQV